MLIASVPILLLTFVGFIIGYVHSFVRRGYRAGMVTGEDTWSWLQRVADEVNEQ